MEKTFSITQCMALAHLHRRMIDFLFDYAEGKTDRTFFINGMAGLIGQIDSLVRENGNYSCSYSRMLDGKLAEKFTTAKRVKREEEEFTRPGGPYTEEGG